MGAAPQPGAAADGPGAPETKAAPASKIRSALELGGAAVRLTLDAGKGNILDLAAIRDLAQAHVSACAVREARAIVLDHAGPHFCFGASVPEHLPGKVEAMLPELHALLSQLVSSELPIIACVRGACLGGGLELALACTRIVAAPDATLGQPEIKLGVFAPFGSLMLPLRVGEGRAAQLLLGGEVATAGAALASGLVDEVATDPAAAGLAWVERHLAPLSGTAVRHGHRALRMRAVEAVKSRLPTLERLYLEELMATADAQEGLAAFLQKRPPTWTHR